MTSKILPLSLLLALLASAGMAATADLTIAAEGAQSSRVPGSDVQYVLRVTNLGPDEATDVTVSDSFSEEAKLGSVSPSQGSASGATEILWNVGTLAPGASATLTVVVNAPGRNFSSGARVQSAETDPNRENNMVSSDFSRKTPGAVPMFSAMGALLVFALAARGVFRKDQ